jgi:hypothetical protein
MRRLGAIGLCLLVLAIPAQAVAGFRFHADPDDTSNRLDISGYRLRHPHRYSITISTYQRFNLERDGGAFYARFDTRGGPRWDYELHVHYDLASEGLFCDAGSRLDSGPQIRPFGWRVDGRSVTCTFGRIERTKAVRTQVWTQDGDGNVVDRAPDDGSFQGH